MGCGGGKRNKEPTTQTTAVGMPVVAPAPMPTLSLEGLQPQPLKPMSLKAPSNAVSPIVKHPEDSMPKFDDAPASVCNFMGFAHTFDSI